MKSMTKNQKLLITGLALLAVIGIFATVWYYAAPATQAGEKQIVVTVQHGDGTTKDFPYTTDAEYLGEVLRESALVTGSEEAYGLYIQAVDGETADATAQQWWCITQNHGETVDTSADATPIIDGGQYELSLITGW